MERLLPVERQPSSSQAFGNDGSQASSRGFYVLPFIPKLYSNQSCQTLLKTGPSLEPEAPRILAGGVSHRITRSNAHRPGRGEGISAAPAGAGFLSTHDPGRCPGLACLRAFGPPAVEPASKVHDRLSEGGPEVGCGAPEARQVYSIHIFRATQLQRSGMKEPPRRTCRSYGAVPPVLTPIYRHGTPTALNSGPPSKTALVSKTPQDLLLILSQIENRGD